MSLKHHLHFNTINSFLTMDKDRPFIRNGAVAVTGNKITVIGTGQEVAKQVASTRRTVDCSELLIMPGLVNM